MTSDEHVVERAVRTWAARTLPGEPVVVERATNLALISYAAGASMHEACAEARTFVDCWARHPSLPRTRGLGPSGASR